MRDILFSGQIYVAVLYDRISVCLRRRVCQSSVYDSTVEVPAKIGLEILFIDFRIIFYME